MSLLMKARAKKKERETILKANNELHLDFDEQEMKLGALKDMLSNADMDNEDSIGSRYYSEVPSQQEEKNLESGEEEETEEELKKKEKDYLEAIIRQSKVREKEKKALAKGKLQQQQEEEFKNKQSILGWMKSSQTDLKALEENEGPVRLSNNDIIKKTNLNSNPLSLQASSDRLKELLSQPCEKRNTITCENIANEIKKVKFLQKYKEMPGFLDICKHLYIKIFEKKQFVFKQGQVGDAFYIILQGSVTIYIDEPTEYKSFMQLREVAKLEQGDSFGEIALVYDSQRTATIISNERTFLIVLEKTVFQTYIKEMKNDHLAKQVEFMECIDFCRRLKKSQVIELTTKLQTKLYTSNEIIGHEGETLPHIIFIKCGRAKIFRSIQFRTNKYLKEKLKGDIKDPSLEDIENHRFVTEMVEIDEISDYSVIGDYSLLYSIPLDVTIVTMIPTEVYYISSYDLIKIVPPDILEKHRKMMKKYPNNLEIRQMYWEKREWESFQKNVIKNIQIEKNNLKGFEKLLKQPPLKFATINTPISLMDIQSSDNSVYIDLLSQRVPRGLQTKKNVAGLQPIYLSIASPNTSTAENLWQQLDLNEDINNFSSEHDKKKTLYKQNKINRFGRISLPSFPVSAKSQVNSVQQ